MTGRNSAAAAFCGLAAPCLPARRTARIGRRQPVPELLDLGDVDLAEIGQRLLGEPRRDADAQAAGDELDDGEARRDAGGVEQAGQHVRPIGAARRLQRRRRPRRASARWLGLRCGRRLRPDQRYGLGEIADIVVGIAEQHRVHALDDQRAQHRRLDRSDRRDRR